MKSTAAWALLTIEELGPENVLAETQLVRDVLGDQQESNRLAGVVITRRQHHARGDAAAVFANATDDAFPFAVVQLLSISNC
jgi:hypothetical protein